jgi:hypothetical protein
VKKSKKKTKKLAKFFSYNSSQTLLTSWLSPNLKKITENIPNNAVFRILILKFRIKKIHFKVIYVYLIKKRPLENFQGIKIWHDNSGSTSEDASWYLKHIVLHDLQTREKHHFLCEKWLAIDIEDCQIERVLSLSSKEDKTKFKYILSQQTKEKLSNDHLWFSVFARPVA